MRKRVIIRNQQELDNCANNGNIAVIINGSYIANGACIIETWNKSELKAYGNCQVTAWNQSKINAYDNVLVKARDKAAIISWNNSKVIAMNESKITAHDCSLVEAYGESSIKAIDDVIVRLFSCMRTVATKGAVVFNHNFSMSEDDFKKAVMCNTMINPTNLVTE